MEPLRAPQIPTTDAMIMAVYEAGRAAYWQRKPQSICPYDDGLLHHAWHAGWLKGSLEELGV